MLAAPGEVFVNQRSEGRRCFHKDYCDTAVNGRQSGGCGDFPIMGWVAAAWPHALTGIALRGMITAGCGWRSRQATGHTRECEAADERRPSMPDGHGSYISGLIAPGRSDGIAPPPPTPNGM